MCDHEQTMSLAHTWKLSVHTLPDHLLATIELHSDFVQQPNVTDNYNEENNVLYTCDKLSASFHETSPDTFHN